MKLINVEKITPGSPKLIQGDCRQQALALPDGCVDLIFTDPPFGLKNHSYQSAYNRDNDKVIPGYVEVPTREYRKFSVEWIKQAERVLRPGGSLYLVIGFTPMPICADVLLRETKLSYVNHIIWKFNLGLPAKRKWVISHYHILYFTKPPKDRVTFNYTCRFSAEHKTATGHSALYADMEDVWQIKKTFQTGQTRNQNSLPGPLIEKALRYSSNEGDLVCDFFMGSFSTAKVAKGLNRRFVGFEANPNTFPVQIPNVRKIKTGEMLALPELAERLRLQAIGRY